MPRLVGGELHLKKLLIITVFDHFHPSVISTYLSFRPQGEIHVPSSARGLLDFSSQQLLEMTKGVQLLEMTNSVLK